MHRTHPTFDADSPTRGATDHRPHAAGAGPEGDRSHSRVGNEPIFGAGSQPLPGGRNRSKRGSRGGMGVPQSPRAPRLTIGGGFGTSDRPSGRNEPSSSAQERRPPTRDGSKPLAGGLGGPVFPKRTQSRAGGGGSREDDSRASGGSGPVRVRDSSAWTSGAGSVPIEPSARPGPDGSGPPARSDAWGPVDGISGLVPPGDGRA